MSKVTTIEDVLKAEANKRFPDRSDFIECEKRRGFIEGAKFAISETENQVKKLKSLLEITYKIHKKSLGNSRYYDLEHNNRFADVEWENFKKENNI